ncbi:hypothetical protein [Burkholderia vietnamiensis]|uniref:hypothetical protein n=1 Tax=Burkholderia vietnamiensis TaxID=60552 RepID=UPI001FC98A58|nr:hypothetical protein [Burkholderia vietnamiensis]
MTGHVDLNRRDACDDGTVGIDFPLGRTPAFEIVQPAEVGAQRKGGRAQRQPAAELGNDDAEWRDELKLHAALFETLKLRLPAELTETMKKIEQRIGN